MFLKVNSTYYASIRVTDVNGNPVDNDTPTMTVYDMKENLYYNGLSWSQGITELVLAGVGNGIYQSQFIAEKTGTFKISITSRNYDISVIDMLEVYDGNIATYQWQTGTLYTVEYNCTEHSAPTCTILRGEDHQYYVDGAWQGTMQENTMSYVNGTHKFSFVPDIDGEYGITVKCGDSEFYYVLQASSIAENIAPILVSNQTLKSLDGTDSCLLDAKGVPLSGVSVTVYNPASKEVAGKTTTNYAGEWSMLLKPGKWHFLFEKQGYISVGFERMVQ
jgi:hypothetical protein